MGKGSGRRPLSVPYDTYAENYELIFGKKEKKKPYVPPPLKTNDICSCDFPTGESEPICLRCGKSFRAVE